MSPDVIPAGTTPLADPGSSLTGSFGREVGQPLGGRGMNFIYIRAKGAASVGAPGRVELYQSEPSLVLFPDQWARSRLLTASGASSTELAAGAPGVVAVAREPFVWIAGEAGQGTPSLIGRIVTAVHPNPIPVMDSIDAFARWVTENPGFGFRTIAWAESTVPMLQQAVRYRHGSVPAEMMFMLTCDGIPVGSQVSFSCSAPLPSGQSVALPPTTVTTTGLFTAGLRCEVDAGWEGSFTYVVVLNGAATAGRVTLQALYLPPAQSELSGRARPLAELGVETRAWRGPSAAILVGGHTTKIA